MDNATFIESPQFNCLAHITHINYFYLSEGVVYAHFTNGDSVLMFKGSEEKAKDYYDKIKFELGFPE
jgi:hypothetical protein